MSSSAAPLLAQAHEGHDHGAPVAAELLPVLAPRAEAAGDLVELLAVAEAGQLTLYLDRFDTNEPIAGARIEVDSGSWKGLASALGDGTYRVAAPALAAPGKHPLVFTVQFQDGAGEQADLLETTLEVPVPAASGTGTTSARGALTSVATAAPLAVGLGVAGGLAALVVWAWWAWWAWRRRRGAALATPVAGGGAA